MKPGEKFVLGMVGVLLVGAVVRNIVFPNTVPVEQRGIPFYSTASSTLARSASDLMRDNQCRSCHSLWSVRDMMRSVPAPALDGLGSLKTEEWFYAYFSSRDPQSIIPSRLKKEYRMPSFADLPDQDRRTLAQYMASLKVKDWYLEDTKKHEYEKLTGKDYPNDRH